VGGKFPSPPAPCSKQPDCNRVEVASPGRQSRLSARIQLCWDRFPTRLNLLVVLPQWPPNGARPPIGAQPSTAAHRSSATRGRPTGLSQHDYQSPCGSPWGSANSGRHPANATGILSPPTSTCSTHSWNRRASQPKPRALLLRTHEQLWDQPNTITTSLPLGTPQFTTWHTHAEYLMIILADPTPPMYSLQSPSVPFPCFDVTPTVTSSHSRCHGTQVTSPLILTCYILTLTLKIYT